VRHYELERVAIELGEWGDAVRFVAATGMRPEEWIPLEHTDIDAQAQTLTIRRTYTEGKTARGVRRHDRRLDSHHSDLVRCPGSPSP
jgi:integrase